MMLWVLIYLICGMVMYIFVNKVMEDKQAKSDNQLVDFMIMTYIIAFWPVFLILLIRSYINYGKDREEKK